MKSKKIVEMIEQEMVDEVYYKMTFDQAKTTVLGWVQEVKAKLNSFESGVNSCQTPEDLNRQVSLNGANFRVISKRYEDGFKWTLNDLIKGK